MLVQDEINIQESSINETIIQCPHLACDVVATSHLGLVLVKTSRTMLRPHHDVETGT